MNGPAWNHGYVEAMEWADRLGDYFTDLDFSPMREAGHFAHYERPDLANHEILEFFQARSR
jgi:hypothetical protein